MGIVIASVPIPTPMMTLSNNKTIKSFAAVAMTTPVIYIYIYIYRARKTALTFFSSYQPMERYGPFISLNKQLQKK